MNKQDKRSLYLALSIICFAIGSVMLFISIDKLATMKTMDWNVVVFYFISGIPIAGGITLLQEYKYDKSDYIK